MGQGPSQVTEPYQTQNAAEMMYGSQTMGDKFHSQKGNSPDPQLRSRNGFKWKRMSSCADNQDVGLEAATPVSYTHLRAHETGRNLVCRLLLEKKKKKRTEGRGKIRNERGRKR